MKDILRKVGFLLSDYRPEHTEFQIENFIIGSQGNEWARYKQVLRELSGRVDGIKTQTEKIRALAAEVASLNGGGWNPIGRKKRRLKTALMRSRLKAERTAFKSKMREFSKFYRIALDLKRSIGEIDGPKRRALESEMWIERARKMAAVDLLSIGGLQRSTVEFIASFPRELRRDILMDLRPENRQKLLSILN